MSFMYFGFFQTWEKFSAVENLIKYLKKNTVYHVTVENKDHIMSLLLSYHEDLGIILILILTSLFKWKSLWVIKHIELIDTWGLSMTCSKSEIWNMHFLIYLEKDSNHVNLSFMFSKVIVSFYIHTCSVWIFSCNIFLSTLFSDILDSAVLVGVYLDPIVLIYISSVSIYSYAYLPFI